MNEKNIFFTPILLAIEQTWKYRKELHLSKS